jgi:hypothetical protein
MTIAKKEIIRDRMIKTAARLWGVQENEIEGNFDPLVTLMIEACAAELEKIGYEISTSHSRLLDRLADLVLPETIIGPKPASCVLHALPNENRAVVNTDNSFHLHHQVNDSANSRQKTVDVHFSPIGEFVVHKAQPVFVQSGNSFYQIRENGWRERLFDFPSKIDRSNEIVIAISCDASVESLVGLQLFFHVNRNAYSGKFYQSLQNADAFAGGKNIPIGKGYFQSAQFELSPEQMLVKGNDFSQKTNFQVAYSYKKHFLHIADDALLTSTSVPDSWIEKLPQELLEKVKAEKLFFLGLRLDQYFPDDVFQGLNCSLNAYPVVNIKRNRFNFRTETWVNIVPLPQDGIFYDLKSVTGSAGNKYRFRYSGDSRQVEAGEALLRSSGIGKTSSREVREMLGILTASIRDKSAYFEDISNDFILSRLKEINQVLAGLEDHLKAAADVEELRYYLLLRPKAEGEVVTVDYYTTNGSDANALKAGSLFTSSDVAIQSRRVVSLTNTVGGNNGVSEAQKKNLLRQQIVSRGKITSAEDVKLLCMQYFGERLADVKVKKGIQVSAIKKEGFSRSIDVMLRYSASVDESMKGELDNICSELEYVLQSQGSSIYPYRIIVENDFV